MRDFNRQKMEEAIAGDDDSYDDSHDDDDYSDDDYSDDGSNINFVNFVYSTIIIIIIITVIIFFHFVIITIIMIINIIIIIIRTERYIQYDKGISTRRMARSRCLPSPHYLPQHTYRSIELSCITLRSIARISSTVHRSLQTIWW